MTSNSNRLAPPLSVRIARPSDLAALRAPDRQLGNAGDGDLSATFALEPGDDFFVLVAEHRGDAATEVAAIAGWCAAGGCRGQERKGWGELYELVAESPSREAVLRALAERAVFRLEEAAFAGVFAEADRDDEPMRRALEKAGFERTDASEGMTVRYVRAVAVDRGRPTPKVRSG